MSRLSDLTPKMLGTFGSQKLKTKAMETFFVLRFLIDTLRKYLHRLGPDFRRLLAACETLAEYVAILKGHGPRLPLQALQEFVGDRILFP